MSSDETEDDEEWIGHPPEAEVRGRLESEGVDVATLKTVSRRPGRFEVVYEVTTAGGGGDTRYVRTLYDERAERFAEFLSKDLPVCMPGSSVLDGDPPILLMDEARGRPLSMLLPILLLPGIWLIKRCQLERGLRMLGSSLGVLHAQTRAKMAPVSDSKIDLEKIEAINEDIEILGLDPCGFDVVSRTLDAVLDLEVVHSMTHRDPAPHNVYYSGGSIQLIDLDLSIRPAMVDVALAEMGLLLMAKRLPYARRRQKRSLIDSFWSGYQQEGIAVVEDEQRFRLVRVYQLSELLWNYLEGDIAGPINRLTSLTDKSVIRAEIHRQCSELGP